MLVESIRDAAVSFGLAILIPMTVVFGIKVFMPEPSWLTAPELYDAQEKVKEIESKIGMLKEQKKFDESQALQPELKIAKDSVLALEKARSDSYEVQRKHHDQVRLIIEGSVGILLMISSFMVPVSFLAGGFLFGGIICIVLGVTSYWSHLDPKLQFFVLLGSLILLILLGYFYVMRERKKML